MQQLQLNNIGFQNILGLLLISYPTLLFLVRGGMNGMMVALGLISIYLIYRDRRERDPLTAFEIVFGIAMSSGLVAIFISQLHHDDFSARHFDSAFRFLLAIPIAYALRYAGGARMYSALQFAFPFGAIAALLAVMVAHPLDGSPVSTAFMNHIHLGDMAILLSFLSLLSINWLGQDGLPIKLIKILGAVAGLIVSILSQARGGWIAAPVFLAVCICAFSKTSYFKRSMIILSSAGVLLLLSYFFVETVQLRIGQIFSDLAQYRAGNADTSIGVRLQLWEATLKLIAENPMFGVGADGFGNAMSSLVELGMITPVAAELGRGEVHNEILAQTVRFGVFGLSFILAAYFVPLYLFLRIARAGNRQHATPALMGICVTLGFLIFGLTVETFNLKMTAAFYCTTIAVLIAAATTCFDMAGDSKGKECKSV